LRRLDGGVDPRQEDREVAAASHLAGHVDAAAGIGDDAVDERETEPGALADLLRREEGLEYARDGRIVHAATRILDREPHVRARLQRSMRQRALRDRV